MKKSFTLLIALLLAITTGAWAQTTGKAGEKITYTLSADKDTLTLSGTGPMTNFSSAGNISWYSHLEKIKKVIVEDGITSIGDYAFWCCRDLTSIDMPACLTSIGVEAFVNCKALKSISLPPNLTSIGELAFDDCSQLKDLTLPSALTSIGAGAFKDCTGLTSVTVLISNPVTLTLGTAIFEKVTTSSIALHVPDILVETYKAYPTWKEFQVSGGGILVNAGSQNPEHGSVSGDIGLFPKGTSIRLYAQANPNYHFLNWTNMMGNEISKENPYRFTLNNTLGETVRACFTDSLGGTVDKLTWSLKQGVLTLSGKGNMPDFGERGELAPWFYNRSEIRQVVIKEGITDIGRGAFSRCYGLTTLTLPEGITSIGEAAFFYCSALTTLTLPDGITSIGRNAFSYCSALATLSLPDGLTSIGHGAFSNCSGLTALSLPDGLTSIGQQTFNECTGLISLTLPDGITSIGYGTFLHCTALTTLTLPAGLTFLEMNAFDNCAALTTITLPVPNPSTIKLGSLSYFGAPASTVNLIVPNSAVEDYKKATVWKDFRVIGGGFFLSAQANNPLYGSVSGKTGLVPTGESRTLTATAKTGCNFINWIDSEGNEISKSNPYTFAPSQDMTLIAQFEENRQGTFDKLTWVLTQGCLTLSGQGNMPNEPYEQIPWYTYRSDIKQVVIGKGITNIEKRAFFSYSDLTSLTLPIGLNRIGDEAFSSCTALSSITLPAIDPATIELGDGVFAGLPDKSLIDLIVPNSAVETFKAAKTWKDFRVTGGGFFLTAQANNPLYGSVSGKMGLIDPGGQTILLSFTATANEGYRFVNWTDATGKVIGTENVYPFVVNKDIIATANFSKEQITGKAGENVIYTLSPDLDTLTLSGTGPMYDYSSSTPWDDARSTIKKLTILEGVTTIGDQAFAGCTALTSIDLPAGLTHIGQWAFSNCTALTSITLPTGLTHIGEWAFALCAALTSIELPASLTQIGGWAFLDCSDLAAIEVDEANTTYYSQDGVLFSKDKTRLILYPSGKKTTAYTVPNGVTTIESYAFYKCAALTSITLPASLTSIGELGIRDCYALTSFLVEDSNPNYCSLDGVLFNKDQTALVLYPSGKKETDYIVPNGVTRIETGAFVNCTALTSITLPAGLTYIGQWAFSGCSALTSITLPVLDPSTIESGGYPFEGVTTSDIELVVPHSAMGDYEADELWKDFKLTAGFFVSAQANNPQYGSVSGKEGFFKKGKILSFTATANEGYQFVNWTDATGTVLETENVYAFAVEKDIVATAHFEEVVGLPTINDTPIAIVYPNPAADEIRLSLAETVTLRIYDLAGRLCLTQTVSPGAAVSVSHLKPGTYLYSVAGKQGKICKQ
ncbi:leucine-rich repeat protein [Bacteroidales bacterium OttesenSCG-928-L03]|nr:leucine-rich repeat protein [Bacteroidales bacterium OttesenSCG-928-L03]